MPKTHTLINKAFQNILDEYTKTEAPLHDSSQKEASKHLLLKKMCLAVETLLKKKQITETSAAYAETALKFYVEHVEILPFQESIIPTLKELVAIDYLYPVKITKVKQNRVMTQMQAQDSHHVTGSFYAEGSLPSNFDQRASMSGIGSKSLVNNNQIVDKSVYQAIVSKDSIFLQSVAAEATDTWSVSQMPQKAQGRGGQWRVSTNDYHHISRPAFAELNKSHSGEKSKLLKKAVRDINLASKINTSTPLNNSPNISKSPSSSTKKHNKRTR